MTNKTSVNTSATNYGSTSIFVYDDSELLKFCF